MGKVWLSVLLPALLLAGPALQLDDEKPIVTQELVDYINSQGKWKASLDWVGNMTKAQARRLTAGKVQSINPPEAKFGYLAEVSNIPSDFDASTEWPNCIGMIRDQGQCGSCWAFASTEVLADRYCIQQGVSVVLSPQWLVSCDTSNTGCIGGWATYTWNYLADTGAPEDACAPYVSGDSKTSGACSYPGCSGFYTSGTAYTYSSPTAIQLAILQSGPVMAQFQVYSDFFAYSSCDIYTHLSSDTEGDGHYVKIVGWGNLEGTNYWKVANSWGTGWGCDGYFFIAFGQCGIDSQASAGQAGYYYSS